MSEESKLPATPAVASTDWLAEEWWDTRVMHCSYKLKRNLRIAAMRLEGKTDSSIGRAEGLSRGRVGQIIDSVIRRVDRRRRWLKVMANAPHEPRGAKNQDA